MAVCECTFLASNQEESDGEKDQLDGEADYWSKSRRHIVHEVLSLPIAIEEYHQEARTYENTTTKSD